MWCVRSGNSFHGKLRMGKLCREPKYLVNSLKNVVAVREKVQTENLKIQSKPTPMPNLKIVLLFYYRGPSPDASRPAKGKN